MVTRVIVLVAVVMAGLWLFVRFAPVSPDDWHHQLAASEPYDRQDLNGFFAVRRVSAPDAQVLMAMERAILATPRARLLAGSVMQGLLTFETRSLIWGFPDYTTVTVHNGFLIIYGRSRFGGSDIGTNKERILGWLAALGPLTEPL